jgi:hypothetical protein
VTQTETKKRKPEKGRSFLIKQKPENHKKGAGQSSTEFGATKEMMNFRQLFWGPFYSGHFLGEKTIC